MSADSRPTEVQGEAEGADSLLPEDTLLALSGLRAARQAAFLIVVLGLVFAGVGQAHLSLRNLLLGLVLHFLTLWPWVRWFQQPGRTLPYFESLNLHFFAVYVPPIFLAPVVFSGVTFEHTLVGPDLTRTLLVLVCALGLFQVAFYHFHRSLAFRLPDFDLDARIAPAWLLGFLALSALGPILLPPFPAALAKVGHLLFQVNASVATYLLAALWQRRLLSPGQVGAFHVVLGLHLMLALASGWLSFAVFPVYAYFLATVQMRKTIPWGPLLVVGVVLLAFNATKNEFRRIHWGAQMGGDPVQSFADGYGRAADWLQLTVEEDLDIVEAQRQTLLDRLNNLSFLAHVMAWTPEQRPHLGWQTYQTVPAMFIPRLLWPEKPSSMLVANDIALRYGALAPTQIGRVALDLGLLPEAYIAFGWWGPLAVSLLLGVGCAALTRLAGDPDHGFFWSAPFLGLICAGGLMITWSMQGFLGGLWQAVAVMLLLYLPLRVRRA